MGKQKLNEIYIVISEGSRISRRGGEWTHWGGVDPQCGRFSVKMYAKMKELGPVGGHAPSTAPLDPPMVMLL